MTVVIERLTVLPVLELAPLVAESEQAGWRILRRLVEDWTSGVNCFDRPGEALFTARDDGRLVGIGGLNVDP